MCSTPSEGTNVSHNCFPSERRKASTDIFAPSSRAVVRKMLSPQTIGDEWPRPGTGTFHFTRSVADHLSVYFPFLTMPWPEGPRQRVQYFAASPSTSIIDTVSKAESAATAPATAARTVRVRCIFIA